MAAVLAGREPPPGLSAEELLSHSWWSGPEIFLLVDDVQQLPAGFDSPLHKAAPWVTRAAGATAVAAPAESTARKPRLDGAVGIGEVRFVIGPRSGDDRYILYTGGTTGVPTTIFWSSPKTKKAIAIW